MPALSWPEIRNRAVAFARDWQDETSERAEAQTFWNEFFEVFGIKRRRVAVYEQQVKQLPHAGETKSGRIDVFWKGTMLAEHKSAGADLDAAHTQALDYFAGLADEDCPRYPDGGRRRYPGDADRVAFLFSRYAELTSLIG